MKKSLTVAVTRKAQPQPVLKNSNPSSPYERKAKMDEDIVSEYITQENCYKTT